MKNQAQVWIETAIYTLIGLTIIAIVISIATPQIEKAKEKAIIKDTINALNSLDEQVKKVSETQGTIKIVKFKIAKGKLEINPELNIIAYTLENIALKFSEKDVAIKEGDLTLITKPYGKRFNVILKLNYTDEQTNKPKLDILYDKTNEGEKIIHGSPSPYEIKIENIGNKIDENGIIGPNKINFHVT